MSKCINCGKPKAKEIDDFCISCTEVLKKLPKEFQKEMRESKKSFDPIKKIIGM